MTLTSAQEELLRQVCQNKNECGAHTATIIVPREAKSAARLFELGLISFSEGEKLATPTEKALACFPQWNPDQLLLFV